MSCSVEAERKPGHKDMLGVGDENGDVPEEGSEGEKSHYPSHRHQL